MRLNWYRGFHRAWLVLSLLWIVSSAAVGIGFAYQQYEFEKRVAAARASDPEAAKHGGLLFTSDGRICGRPLYVVESRPLPATPPAQTDGKDIGWEDAPPPTPPSNITTDSRETTYQSAPAETPKAPPAA